MIEERMTDQEFAEWVRRMGHVRCGLLSNCACPPRTWSLPPEPGPEVKAVRDSRGRTFARGSEGKWWEVFTFDPKIMWEDVEDDFAWPEILTYSPLTDTTAELEEE